MSTSSVYLEISLRLVSIVWCLPGNMRSKNKFTGQGFLTNIAFWNIFLRCVFRPKIFYFGNFLSHFPSFTTLYIPYTYSPTISFFPIYFLTQNFLSFYLLQPSSTFFNLLQPTSTFFNLLQPFSTFFNLFQPFSTFFNIFQHFSTFFNIFQPFSTFFNLFQPSSTFFNFLLSSSTFNPIQSPYSSSRYLLWFLRVFDAANVAGQSLQVNLQALWVSQVNGDINITALRSPRFFLSYQGGLEGSFDIWNKKFRY